MSVKLIFLLLFIITSDLPAQTHNITLMFSGDVTLSDHFENYVGNRFNYAFKKLDWFSDADITMINLETTLTTANNPIPKAFNFKARPAYAKMLKDSGIEVVTLANNHIYDFDAEGLLQTIKALDQVGLKHVGAGKNNTDARKAVIFEIKNIKLAYFGYYGSGKHSESFPATRKSPGTAMRSLTYIARDIAAVRDSVDLIIINFHWGREKAHYPEQSEIDFAHATVDFGADIIVGHHPHVLQGVEIYHDKLIVYSLGNFIFGGNSRTLDRSAVLRVMVDPSLPHNYKAALIPIQIDYWQPYRLRGAWADSVCAQLETYSSPFPFTALHINNGQILNIERAYIKPKIKDLNSKLMISNYPYLQIAPLNEQRKEITIK